MLRNRWPCVISEQTQEKKRDLSRRPLVISEQTHEITFLSMKYYVLITLKISNQSVLLLVIPTMLHVPTNKFSVTSTSSTAATPLTFIISMCP